MLPQSLDSKGKKMSTCTMALSQVVFIQAEILGQSRWVASGAVIAFLEPVCKGLPVEIGACSGGEPGMVVNPGRRIWEEIEFVTDRFPGRRLWSGVEVIAELIGEAY